MRINKLLLIFLIFLLARTEGFSQTPTDSLIRALAEMKEDSHKVFALNTIAYQHWESQPAKSLEYINQAISLAKTLNYQKGLGSAYNLKAGIYRIYGNAPKALEELLIAEKCFKQANDKFQLSNVISNIGATYFDIGEDSIALIYADRAIALKQELKDTAGYTMSLIGKGITLQQMGQSTEALKFYKEAQALLGENSDPRALSVLNSNFATYYFEQKNHQKALSFCYKCQEIALKFQLKRQLFDAKECIVQNLLVLDRYDSIHNHLNKMSTLLTELKDYPSYLVWSNLAAKFYENENRLDSALFYQKQAKAYTDSLYQQEKQKESQRLEVIQNLAKKEQEASQLTAVKQQQQEIIQLQYFVGTLILLILIVIIFLLYQQYKSNKTLKEQRSALERSKEELEQLNQTKNQLFSIISHDLMSPLNALSGILQLQKDGIIGEDELPDFLDEAMVEVGNTTVFLRNLLLWAKNQMEGLQVNKKPVYLSKLIHQNVELLAPQARKKNIELRVEELSTAEIIADEDLLNTVIRNLMANAIKFTNEGGFVKVKATTKAQKMLVEVIDNGVGMDLATQEKVFSEELFSTYGTANEKGTGLGLQLCQDFIRKNGGVLKLESEKGKGSRLYFDLALS